MTTTIQPPPVIEVEFPEAFHSGWNKINGITVEGRLLRLDPDEYFFRYENPTWLVCDWDKLRAELLDAQETSDVSVEQMALDYIKANGQSTDDPARVLRIAWEVSAFLFREENLHAPGLITMGAKERHLRMLREGATLMALNKVELDGRASNVGPAWMLPIACKVVYGLNDRQARLVDELYHGTWFDERRRVEAVKANAALGGKLVHGCQSQQDMRGGCVVPYGVDLTEFRRELQNFGDDWIERVEAGDR